MKFSKHFTALLVFLAGAAVARAGESEVRAAVVALVPHAKIDSLTMSAAPGFYEVVVDGQVLYVHEQGGHMFVGDLWGLPDRINETLAVKNRIRRDAVAAVGAERRIRFFAAREKHVVTVFTDFDCGYCRKLHSDIGKINDLGISIDYLLHPRSGRGTPSFDKAVSVWCAPDRKKAFTLAKQGGTPEPATCANPIEENIDLVVRTGGFVGTPMIVDAAGAVSGYRTPDDLLTWLERSQ